jgi:glycosyltransferase involved in cell wall biosynthesis
MSLAEFSQQELDSLKGKRVMIATPCYGGQLSVYYFKSYLDLISEFSSRGVDYVLSMISNESLITRARNTIASNFLTYEDAKGKLDYLFFIDSDIQFHPHAALRLLLHDKDVITASYPMKVIDFSNVENQALSASDLATNTTSYAINLKFDSEEQREKGQLRLKDGLLELVDGATGFMLIKRNVLETMRDVFPELAYSNDSIDVKLDGSSEIKKVNHYAFFDTMIDPNDKRYLSEDYAFCRRWQSLGNKVWLDPFIKLNHVGNHIFQGRPLIKEEKA